MTVTLTDATTPAAETMHRSWCAVEPDDECFGDCLSGATYFELTNHRGEAGEGCVMASTSLDGRPLVYCSLEVCEGANLTPGEAERFAAALLRYARLARQP